MRFLLALVVLIAASLSMSSTTYAAPVATNHCQYVFGFRAIKDMIPDKVSDCLENEHHNPENGDGLQRTMGGLLVWRKIDNWTAFTDGYRTWVNGPNGLQQRLNTERFPWEKDPVTQPAPSQPGSAPAPSMPISYVGPLVLENDNWSAELGFLVANNTSEAKSFKISVTFKQGTNIVAHDTEDVNSLAPGQNRAAKMYLGKPLPAHDSVRVDIEDLRSSDTIKARAAMASKITVGSPSTTTTMGEAHVEVTNTDSVLHRGAIILGFMDGDKLLAVGEGHTGDLAPGQTKTIDLLIYGNHNGFNRTLTAVELSQ